MGYYTADGQYIEDGFNDQPQDFVQFPQGGGAAPGPTPAPTPPIPPGGPNQTGFVNQNGSAGGRH